MNYTGDYYDYLIETTCNYSDSDYELIKKQNKKSKEILEEYEKIAQEKRENNNKEEKDVINEIKAKENEISTLNKEKSDLNSSFYSKNRNNINTSDIVKRIDDIDDIIQDLEDKLDSMEACLRKIKSRDIYPHGNGLFGFALLYYEISQKLDTEWKDPIYTWTILGYKAVYPKHAIDYIQYKKDIGTSKSLMCVIENKLRSEGKNIYELDKDTWATEINNYLLENNIIIEDNIIFRPHKHNNLRNETNKDDVQYYRITKTDLINSEIDYDNIDVIDYDFLMNMEYESDEDDKSDK